MNNSKLNKFCEGCIYLHIPNKNKKDKKYWCCEYGKPAYKAQGSCRQNNSKCTTKSVYPR